MKITICIVTFHKDYKLLERLITSIENNWNHDCIEEILIVVNDLIELEITSKLNLRIIYSNIPVYNWYSQQLLKLTVAKEIKTDYFIIHDSKDYYTDGEKINLSFYFKDNKSIGSWAKAPNYTHFLNEFKNAYAIWNLNFDSVTGKLNEHTPIILKKDIMLDLLQEFSQVNLLEKFETHIYTEFAIISAYIEYKKLFKELYITIEEDFKMFSRIQPRVKADRSLHIESKEI